MSSPDLMTTPTRPELHTAASGHGHPRHPAHPYRTMMGLYLGAFAGMYSETSLNIALPQFSAEFGKSLALTQWLVVGYMLVIGIVLPLASLLMKHYTVRSLTMTALGAFLLGSVLCTIAPTFSLILAGRMIQGVGTGLILPMLFAVTMRVFPLNRIGAAMGMAGLIIMFAPAIGPTAAGLLIQALSWRALFASFALIALVALGFAAAYLVNPFELSKPRIDLLSCVCSIVGFGGIVLATSMAAEVGATSPLVLGALACGVLGIAIYVRRQLRSTHPVLDLRTFTLAGFRLGTSVVMLNFGITLAAMFLIPQYLQSAAGLDAATAGMLLLPAGIVNALVSWAAGAAYDRLGARTLVPAGLAVSVLALCLIVTVAHAVSVPMIVLGNVLLMVGVPLAMSPAQSHALAALPHSLSSDGSTLSNTLQQVVGAICTALATMILQAGIAHASGVAPNAAYAQGATLAFGFPLVLALIGLLVALRLRAHSPRPQKAERL